MTALIVFFYFQQITTDMLRHDLWKSSISLRTAQISSLKPAFYVFAF